MSFQTIISNKTKAGELLTDRAYDTIREGIRELNPLIEREVLGEEIYGIRNGGQAL